MCYFGFWILDFGFSAYGYLGPAKVMKMGLRAKGV
jgi:hypothetical protein